MRYLNPTVLAIVVFYSTGLVLAGVASAQQSSPFNPPGFNPQGSSRDQNPYISKPLPDTVYGQPIDSSQTADAVLNYVQREVESRVRVSPGRTDYLGGNTYVAVPPTLDLSPALRDAMAPIVARFGVENLQRALKLGTQPKRIMGDVSNTSDILKGYEGSIIQEALSLAQGSSTKAEDRPLASTKNSLPNFPPPATTPIPAPAPPTVPSPAPPAVTNAAPVATPPSIAAPLQTATVTAKTKIEAHTPSGGYAALPLDVGDQLTILSINTDGTVTAEAKYHFQGTVLQSNIRLNPAPTP